MSQEIFYNLDLQRSKRRYFSTLQYLKHIQQSGKISLLTRSQINAIRSRLKRCLEVIRKYLKLATLTTGIYAIGNVNLDAQCRMNRLPISTQTSFPISHRNSAPALADLDMDGDFDLIIGHGSDSISTYINLSGSFHRSYGLANPFHNVNIESPRPTFVDIDYDGDPDAFIGEREGRIHYFRNDNGVFSEVTGAANPLNVNVGNKSAPTFVDIEGDGDPDAFISTSNGFHFFKNDNGVFSEITGAGNPFDGESGAFGSPIAFVDFDNDGDADAFVGTYLGGKLRFFRNVNGVFTEVAGNENPFNEAKIGAYTRPTFADIDGDGDSDAFIGKYHSRLHFFRNDNGSFTEEIVSDNSFNNVDVGGSSAPTFGDLDKDNNEDVIVGSFVGTIRTFINNNGIFNEATGTSNPFDGYDVGGSSKPVLMDFDPTDLDHDLDLFVGAGDGTIHYFRNDNGTFTHVTGSGNPFNGETVVSSAAPTFLEFDGDGDKDAFVGAADGTIHYFRNDDGIFNEVTGEGNPFNGVNVGSYATPAVLRQNQRRVLVGSGDGTIKEYKRILDKFVLVDDSPWQGVDVRRYSAPSVPPGQNVFVGNGEGGILVFSDQGGRSNVWQGPFTSNWHGPSSNWELMNIPTSGCDNVHVFENSVLKVDPSQVAEGRTLTVRQGGQFEVKAAAELSLDPE